MPKFRQSLYHQLLFRYHVMDDRSIVNPGLPPFYNEEFFSLIRQVHHQSPLNVAQMSEKQWYRVLLEDKVTMLETEVSQQFIPCRAEIKNPEFDWVSIWPRVRLRGLGAELSSFLFKVLHDLLPTQERVARTSQTINGDCKLCLPHVHAEEDLLHALVSCPSNQGVGHAVLHCLPTDNRVDDYKALRLQIELDESLEYPAVWYLAVAWSSIWESRRLGRRPELYKVRADLEAKVSLLRETSRFKDAAEIITSMISKL